MVGLIGGMGWESSAEYYRVLNAEVRRRIGGDRSARCLLWSFDFAELSPLVARRDWTPLIDRLVEAAVGLEQQGADLLAICSNTSHIAADAIEAATPIRSARRCISETFAGLASSAPARPSNSRSCLGGGAITGSIYACLGRRRASDLKLSSTSTC